MTEFDPPFLLRNPHAMTLAAAFWPRSFPDLPASSPRFFEIESGTRVRADCHWQPEATAHPALILVHGLEGSSDSGYMRGTAEKAFRAGFNVLRLNQRNCGGTDELTPTLYNSSLSVDSRNVVLELIEKDRLREMFVAGFSMGGNLVLKMAAEFDSAAPEELRAVAGICPSCDLAACADAIHLGQNALYERHFVRALKKRMRHKVKLFPGRYALDGIDEVRSVREFDDVITAPYCGFRDADDYYARSSALPLLGKISVPALILTAQDDPMVPFASFHAPSLRENPRITLLAPERGGHCAFISRSSAGDRFWAESRIVEFCLSHSRLIPPRGSASAEVRE